MTKIAFIKHLQTFPTISYSWEELWPQLQKQGWLCKQDGNDFTQALNVKLIRHSPRRENKNNYHWRYCFPMETEDQQSPGLHVFQSSKSVQMFLARFPYLLSNDSTLKVLLRERGWNDKSKKGMWTSPLSCTSEAFADIRTFLWRNPQMLFENGFEEQSTGKDKVLKALTIPLEEDSKNSSLDETVEKNQRSERTQRDMLKYIAQHREIRMGDGRNPNTGFMFQIEHHAKNLLCELGWEFKVAKDSVLSNHCNEDWWMDMQVLCCTV